MNYPDSDTVNTTSKKTRFSSATLALIVGLAWAAVSSVALAGEPIPGVDVKLGKNPRGSIMVAPTGADGAYQFKGLAAGSYDLLVGGKLVQTLRVDNKGTISGVLSNEPDGTKSLSINGKVVPVVIEPAGAPVNTSRSNKKAGIAKGGIPPKVEVPGTLAISQSNDKEGVATTRGTAAPPPADLNGDGKLPGMASPGTPIQGTPIGLEGDPGSIKVSAKTDANGAFHFDKLPAGNYKLKLPGLDAKSIIVGTNGKTGGTVMRSGNDVIVTGDFEGSPAKVTLNSNATIGVDTGSSKAAEEFQKALNKHNTAKNPSSGSGSNNPLGAIPGAMNPNIMIPLPGTINPGAMNPGGGAGGAMRP